MSDNIALDVWRCPMLDNDAKADTVGDYLLALAREVWVEDEMFSGKRPFGNSGWQQEVYLSLAAGGFIDSCDPDEWGYVEITESEEAKAHELVLEALDLLKSPSPPTLVDDPDLPASLQGKTAPGWWLSSPDPSADEIEISGCCIGGTCDCGS